MEPNIKEAERRIAEARETRAEVLDLGDLCFRELPASLASLSNLKSLDLSMTSDDVNLFEDLSPLSSLEKIQTLDLLRSIRVEDLTPLSSLQDLQNLILSYTSVTDLSPLSGLKNLKHLDLSRTRVEDLSPLSSLKNLEYLDLSHTSVRDLSPLSGLKNLRYLDLDLTIAGDLSPLAGLPDLQVLEVGEAYGDLSALSNLRNLKSLNLYDYWGAIPIELIRFFVTHPSLTQLAAANAVAVPREVLSASHYDNCLPRLRTYISELDLEAEAENEVKVILLGNGRVGKTQLCRCLRGKPFNESIESTHGVQIWRNELRIQTGGKEQAFNVNWWDFGGQDIYHGTHALFLRSRAVFLILWTPHLENRDEYDDNGVAVRNQPLSYWLNYVRTLAGSESPIIIVQSQCDRTTDRRADPPRPEGVGFFECCSFSAKEGAGRKTLDGLLRDGMRYLLERNGALLIGRGRAEVRRRLYKWRIEDQKRRPEKRKHRTLTVDEFRVLCDKVGGIVSWEQALDYFHQTGVVFYRPDLFSNCIVLDQDWALEGVYAVFRRDQMLFWLRENGTFALEDLAATVWQGRSLDQQRLLLSIMESCGVCFPWVKTNQGTMRYVVPDLLPKFKMKGGLYAWKEGPDTPTLRLEYHFFHHAIIRDLMSQIGREAGEAAEYWKYGLWFKDGRRDTQFLLKLEDTSTDKEPGAGALELKAQGRDSLGLLREIRTAIFRQQIGEKPEEFLTLDGTTVERSALANTIEGKVLDSRHQPVLAAPFAAFFEGREYEPEKLMVAGEQPKIDIDPRPLNETEKPREVFISYAWGDDSPEGKVRSEVVDRLCSALAGDGFAPIRDRDKMRPGDLISAFIRSLTRADRVVAVVSDKYLRSPYCMYEIYKVWQKYQGEAEEMVQHVVPIVLPEVKVVNFEDRAPYLEFWSERAEKLEALVRKPNLRPSRESWEEVRLVREFAHHIDDILVFINDVLMPRDLKVHFEGDFEAVREALRRRLG